MSRVREHFDALGIVEDANVSDDVRRLGAKVFTRPRMGFGSPEAWLRVDDEATMIQPPEIRMVLDIFGVAVEDFRNALVA